MINAAANARARISPEDARMIPAMSAPFWLMLPPTFKSVLDVLNLNGNFILNPSSSRVNIKKAHRLQPMGFLLVCPLYVSNIFKLSKTCEPYRGANHTSIST